MVEGTDTKICFGEYVHARANFRVDLSKTPVAIDYFNTEGSAAAKLHGGFTNWMAQT